MIEMLRIEICLIESLIMQEAGLNLRGLVPSTRVDWIGTDMIKKERKGFKGMDWRELDKKG